MRRIADGDIRSTDLRRCRYEQLDGARCLWKCGGWLEPCATALTCTSTEGSRVSDIDTNALTTRTTLRPSFEGTNIRTWIGFKHLMYLAHEAVIDHLRER